MRKAEKGVSFRITMQKNKNIPIHIFLDITIEFHLFLFYLLNFIFPILYLFFN